MQRADAAREGPLAAQSKPAAPCHPPAIGMSGDPVERMLFLQRTAGNQAITGIRNAVRTPGQPLDAASRARMEAGFGRDLSQVRVHTDGDAGESAAAIHAEAYTVGQDVVFGEGQYAPDTTPGRTLLAHELAHTIQQRDVAAPPPSNDPASAVETSARDAANSVAAGQPVAAAMPSAGVGVSMNAVPERERAVREAEAYLAESKRKEKEEEEPRKGEPPRRIGEIPTTSSLIPVDPRWNVDRLMKQQVSDPDWDAYVTQRDTEERNRRIKREVNDELRTDRFVALRKFVDQKRPHRDDLAPFLSKHYSMRDLQILRRYGFKWGTRSAGTTKFQNTLVSAIEGYLADQHNQQFGGAPTMREWTQEDEDARVKQLQQEAHIKAWLEGLPDVNGSVLGGASAWVASKFTDDPAKITAAAKFGTGLSGALGSLAQRKAQQGSYVPEAEVPFSVWRYRVSPTKAVDAPKPTPPTEAAPPQPGFPKVDLSKPFQVPVELPAPAPQATTATPVRKRAAAPDDVLSGFIERLGATENPFSLNIGAQRAQKIMTGEKNFALNSPIAFDVDEPLAVGAGGIKPQRAVDRATDPHNRQLLDPQTNRTTKHVRESEADIARHNEKLDPVSLLDEPNAVFTRRFDEVTELHAVFRQADTKVRDRGKLTATDLKAAINKNIREIIRDGSTPEGRVVRDTLRKLGFEYVEKRGFVAVSR